MRRLSLVLAVIAAAVASSGCERLCAPSGIGVFCPEGPDNPLNERPSAGFELSYPPAGEEAEPERLPRGDTVETGRDVIVRSVARDPDGDDLFLEWDLDGDGRFERSGYESAVGSVDAVFRTSGSRRLTLRVTDFPTRLGAPGEATRTRELHAVDRAANRPPRAVLAAGPNPAVAGEEVTFDATGSSDPDFYDAGNLTATWALEPLRNNFYPGGLRIARRFFEAGTEDVRVKVRDFFGAESVAEVSVRVLTGHAGNRPPTAALVAIPNPVEAGEDVTYDASASSDPDGDVLQYVWDADGDDRVDPDTNTLDDPVFGPLNGFSTPGEYPIHVEVRDPSGATDLATVVQRVVPASDENLPPTARFTPTPFSPMVGDPVMLDASASSDPEGEPIARYEWDLDGNGSFEADNGDDPVITTSYETPGERFVRLRVTDAEGATGTTGRTILVRPPPSAFTRAAPFPAALVARSGRAPATELPFSARLRGSPLPVGRGDRRRRGSRLSLLGVLGRGRLRARIVDPPGRASRAERALRRFLRAPWRTRVSFAYDRRTARWTARGIAVARARRGRSDAACLRVRLTGRPGRHPTGHLELLGGTGAATRLHGGARFRFRLERTGSATVLGRVRIRPGPKRLLPARCRALAPAQRR